MFARTHPNLDTFENATPNGRLPPSNGDGDSFSSSIKRSKKPREKLTFWFVNGIISPPGAIVTIPIAGEGIRNLLDVTATKLSRLPFPFLDRLDQFSGWADLDIAHLMSALMLIATSMMWIRLIREAKGDGEVLKYKFTNPPLFWFYTVVAMSVILLDGFIFFLGVKSRGGGWSGEMPLYVPFVCTAFYMVLVAAYGIFHADYATGKKV